MLEKGKYNIAILCVTRSRVKTDILFAGNGYFKNWINRYRPNFLSKVELDYIIDKKILYPWKNRLDPDFDLPKELVVNYSEKGRKSRFFTPHTFLKEHKIDVTETELENRISDELLALGVCSFCSSRGFTSNCANTRALAIVGVLVDYIRRENNFLSTLDLLQVIYIPG